MSRFLVLPAPARSHSACGGVEGKALCVGNDSLLATLRHRPDRIILGEIRGGKAFDLLQLLNTGHSGTLSTVHATQRFVSEMLEICTYDPSSDHYDFHLIAA